MQSHDDRSRTTFGKRRLLKAAPGLQAEPSIERTGGARPRRPAGPLPWALRVAGLVGILAVTAASQLARLNRSDDRPAVTALAAAAHPAESGSADPETTGALASVPSARSTRLDPCRAPEADRLRP